MIRKMNRKLKPYRRKSLEKRLLENRKIEGECWIWTKYRDKDGYGVIEVNYRAQQVHRIAAVLFLGYNIVLTNGDYQVNHTCPNKHCFNPEHLYIGSKKENTRDALKLGTFTSGLKDWPKKRLGRKN